MKLKTKDQYVVTTEMNLFAKANYGKGYIYKVDTTYVTGNTSNPDESIKLMDLYNSEVKFMVTRKFLDDNFLVIQTSYSLDDEDALDDKFTRMNEYFKAVK